MRSRDYIQIKARVMGTTIDELVPGYESGTGTNPIGLCGELPSEREVVRVLELLDDVFFPGYRAYPTSPNSIETTLIERLDEAYDLLHRQVRLAMPLRTRGKYAGSPTDAGCADGADVGAEASRILEEFFARIPSVRELLKLDVDAAYVGDPAAYSRTEIILSYPGIRAITTHRIAHELYRLDVPLIPRMMNEYIHAHTGIDIHPGARIGERFFIDHGTGIVIGETTLIGNRVRIYHGVTLGAYSVKLDSQGQPIRAGKRHPTLEDDVIVYPSATILGGDTVVGRGAVVGSNVWLTRSIPEGATVAYAPTVTLRNGEPASS